MLKYSKIITPTMQSYWKLSSSSKDIDPSKLCSAVLAVYTKRVALRNVTQLCKVLSRPVRNLLHAIEEKQERLMETGKVMLVESQDKEPG